MAGLIVIQILAQLFLKGGMNDLFSMYFALQVVCYLMIYDVPMPSNAEIYISELVKLIEFRILKPEGIV